MTEGKAERYVFGMAVPVKLVGGPRDGEEYVLIPMGALGIPSRLSYIMDTVIETWERVAGPATWAELPKGSRVAPLLYEHRGREPLIRGGFAAVRDAGRVMRALMDNEAPNRYSSDRARQSWAAAAAWDAAVKGLPFPAEMCEWRRRDFVCLHPLHAWEPCRSVDCPYPERRPIPYLWPHSREACAWKAAGKYGECPGCGLRVYVDEGERKVSFVDPERFGDHKYPEAPNRTSDCAYGCGCCAGPARSGGPVDPFGPCPKNPRDGGERAECEKREGEAT